MQPHCLPCHVSDLVLGSPASRNFPYQATRASIVLQHERRLSEDLATSATPKGASSEMAELIYARGMAGNAPSCCMRENRFATPQCSVILPLRTRMTSTVSKWIFRPVGATPRNAPSWVP
jgi:hypothetical protein